MIYIGLVIIIAAPDHTGPIIHPSYAKMYAEEAIATEEFRQRSHKISCDLCGHWSGWYATAGRAKMGLSGHQKSCRRAKPSKVS